MKIVNQNRNLMKLKSIFKSTEKTSFKKKMWHSLKKHVGLLTSLVTDSVILKMSQLSIQPACQFTTNSNVAKSLRYSNTSLNSDYLNYLIMLTL